MSQYLCLPMGPASHSRQNAHPTVFPTGNDHPRVDQAGTHHSTVSPHTRQFAQLVWVSHLLPFSASLAQSLPTGSPTNFLLAEVPRGLWARLHPDLYTPSEPPQTLLVSSSSHQSKTDEAGKAQRASQKRHQSAGRIEE